MAKSMIVHTADDHIFKLKVEPAVLEGYAEVTIYELRKGIFYSYCKTYTFNVMEYDSIAQGALDMLNTYQAEVYTENEIARKWQEFERKG